MFITNPVDMLYFQFIYAILRRYVRFCRNAKSPSFLFCIRYACYFAWRLYWQCKLTRPGRTFQRSRKEAVGPLLSSNYGTSTLLKIGLIRSRTATRPRLLGTRSHVQESRLVRLLMLVQKQSVNQANIIFTKGGQNYWWFFNTISGNSLYWSTGTHSLTDWWQSMYKMAPSFVAVCSMNVFRQSAVSSSFVSLVIIPYF